MGKGFGSQVKTEKKIDFFKVKKQQLSSINAIQNNLLN